MADAVGATWAGRGWFTVAHEPDEDWSTDLFPSIWSLWQAHRQADTILIAIPIGLPDPSDGRRRCDERAKALLGDRHPGIYYAPVRPAVYEPTLDAAKAITERAGYSIQNQAWRLVPRIREVDEFLDAQPGARDRLRESHPEVCLQTMAPGRLEHSPRTADGLEERQEILYDAAPSLADPCRLAIRDFTSPRYAPAVSDPLAVLGAFVLARTATRIDRCATLPVAPPTDARGLPMEIVYPAPSQQLTLESLG